MSEPFRDALAAALEDASSASLNPGRPYPSLARHAEQEAAADIIAALPPEWRDYLVAREPLLALVAAGIRAAAAMDALHGHCDDEGQCIDIDHSEARRALYRRLADPAIVKLREAGRG